MASWGSGQKPKEEPDAETFYVSCGLVVWDGLMVLGLPMAREPWAKGCIGFMPIFSSEAAAQAYSDTQDTHPGISPIACPGSGQKPKEAPAMDAVAEARAKEAQPSNDKAP